MPDKIFLWAMLSKLIKETWSAIKPAAPFVGCRNGLRLFAILHLKNRFFTRLPLTFPLMTICTKATAGCNPVFSHALLAHNSQETLDNAEISLRFQERPIS